MALPFLPLPLPEARNKQYAAVSDASKGEGGLVFSLGKTACVFSSADRTYQ